MPVPSTMMAFRLTTVGTPAGRVTSATARIIGKGPMAITRLGTGSRVITSATAPVTRPARPWLPSSVQTISSSLISAKRSSQKTKALLRKPMMLVTRWPACLKARACGKMGATPSPPPTSTTCPGSSMWLAIPRGPTKSRNQSPWA